MENHPQPEDHQWRVHEDHVAALYRLLGYTVEHNVSAGGQQVDLICEKWIEGLGITRLYIDCKHTRHNINSSVSKDDVASFIYAFRANAEPQSWTGGVMVSNRPFSQYAKALAKGHANLHLKTIEELHEEILHIRAYLHECVRRYDSDGRFTDYIPPYASVSDMPSPSESPGRTTAKVRVSLSVATLV